MLGFSNHTSGYYDLEIDNGKYYLEVVPVQFSGELGVKSRKLYVNPNVSYDIDAPNVYMSPGEMVGYFGEAIELSAESDEDDVEFVWDLNLGIDSDGDGVFDNDSDSFEKVVSVELLSSDGQGVSLRGRDEAGNYSDISTIFADISAPDLVLFDSKIKDGVSGVAYPGARVGLFRKRGGANPSMISTVEADDGGEFSFDDLNYGTNGVKLYSSSKSKAVFDISSGGVMNSLDSGLTISSVEDDEWLRFVLEASGADVLDVKMRFDMGNVKIYDNDVVYEGSDEGIYLMKSPDINVEPVNGGLSVLKKGDFLFEIVNNGKIRLGKSKILDVSADGVEFGLGGESVAVFKWNLRDSISISTASAGSMDSSDANDGVYLEDLNSRDDYSLVYDSDIVSGDEVFVGVMSKEGIIVSRTSSKFY
jgi:hypothetical protein